ncbi:hypothetical protein C8J55DRAFT_220177 [Lentinula edodes]|uniref:DUF6593 domain-containing protein n=1 Tax=Lentinula lateritia TaxID=40482 RepID=A0A9W9AZI9_9AGAR|nr:hypothetical protein C8J55DRAFT_220177 [Lentinula edodes]
MSVAPFLSLSMTVLATVHSGEGSGTNDLPLDGYPTDPTRAQVIHIRFLRFFWSLIDFISFHHPVTGLSHGLTTFHRQNLTTNIFETAGQIEWSSDYNATVHFGLEEVHIRDLRKAKKSSSRSRRFKAAGSEYKWKMASDSVDLFCVDSRGKVIASWNQEQSNLLVSPKGESILDRLVVTCFLNLWALRHLGQW